MRHALRFVLLLTAAALALPAAAQPDDAPGDADMGPNYFRQAALIDVLEKRADDLDDVPAVYFDYHVVESDSRLQARLNLYNRYGGDKIKPLLQLLNRNTLEDLRKGDTLIVPTRFDLDWRAYSPFPRYYPGARSEEKLVILDKSIQAFAAYEYGRLLRWGIINTGAESSRTPSGRFNINWKQEYRISTLSPDYGSDAPDAELWEMHWVMNVHEGRGIHLHQYALPTGGPASHGCVRMLEPDAKWLYFWTDTWEKTGGTDISSVGAQIHRQGTMVLIIGDDIEGTPEPFLRRPRHPILKMVQLPPDPYQVEAGTGQQVAFDRKSGRR
jgi:hypothetical protein